MSKKSEQAAAESRAASIAASWEDPKVRAARIERTGVRVAGTEYRSCAEAFRALKLPMGSMVRFRLQLKEAGKATFEDAKGNKHNFVALAIDKPTPAKKAPAKKATPAKKGAKKAAKKASDKPQARGAK